MHGMTDQSESLGCMHVGFFTLQRILHTSNREHGQLQQRYAAVSLIAKQVVCAALELPDFQLSSRKRHTIR
jgi:hypothetical protein